MMTKTNRLYARTGATAIAAALALSSTPGLAQQVQTLPSTSAPTTTTTTTVITPAPAPATEPAQGADAATTTDTAAPAAEAVPAKRVTTKVKRPAAVATRAQAQSLARTLADRSAARPAAPVAATAATAVPATPVASASAEGSAVANPAASRAPAAKPSNGVDERALELGGGALALLALGGAAFAVTRRRRDDDEEAWSNETIDAENVAPPGADVDDDLPQAAIVAPAASAFAWGDRAPMANAEPHSGAMSDDRLPGESWTERAQRGPSHDNPSLSLKKRLKRAAFFDQREHEVAAGNAVPVDADAGLPEAMTDELESV